MKCTKKYANTISMTEEIRLKPGYDYDQENNVEFENNRRVLLYHGMIG